MTVMNPEKPQKKRKASYRTDPIEVVSVNMPSVMKEAFEELANEHFVTRQVAIITALREYLEKLGRLPKPRMQ